MPEVKKDLSQEIMSDKATIDYLNKEISSLRDQIESLTKELAATKKSWQKDLLSTQSAEITVASVLVSSGELANIQDRLDHAGDLRLDSQQVGELRDRRAQILKSLVG